MRFMMIVKAPAYTGLPDPAQFEAMGRYNDELQRAGVLLDLSTEVHPGEHVEVEIRQILELEDLPVSPERVAAKKALEQKALEQRKH